uniref:Reverse transcriptase/retrotransposon-derived protein RNase H-like domain-containing protein n=1 Tax=Megaselia scalaris TaxID=36166 RepID=T1GSL2_MEGSC
MNSAGYTLISIRTAECLLKITTTDFVSKISKALKLLIKRLTIVLATDASEYGMGSALLHKFDDGSLHPIMHFSVTFNSA